MCILCTCIHMYMLIRVHTYMHRLTRTKEDLVVGYKAELAFPGSHLMEHAHS